MNTGEIKSLVCDPQSTFTLAMLWTLELCDYAAQMREQLWSSSLI